MERPPHVDRLIALVEELTTPVVQVWGWPGSGRSALLQALLETDGAAGLAPSDLGSEDASSDAPGALRRALEGGARRLIVPAPPPGPAPAKVLRALAEALPAGRRLVIATPRRLVLSDALYGLVTPRDLLLRADEVARLWRQATGRSPGPAEAAHLRAISDGWYRPLQLAAASAAGTLPASAAEIAALPAVADFLRHRVLAGLDEPERRALGDRTVPEERAGGPAVDRLRDELGLLLETAAGTLRPPVLLAAAADRGSARERLRQPAAAALQPAEEAEPPAAAARPLPGEPLGPAEQPAFRLRFLGLPEVHRRTAGGAGDEDWERVAFSLRRGLRVLAYLATSPERRAARDELEEAVWPEADRETIERNFHPTLSRLRRDLRGGASAGSSGGTGEPSVDPLVLVDGVYELPAEAGWWIDHEEAARLAMRGAELATAGRDSEAVGRWEEAWRLYRGPLLEGLYEPWAAERREAVQRRHLRLLADLAAAYERLGRTAEAVDAYRAVLAEDPLQERNHVALMRLYSARGRRDLVRRQYERLASLLREELGIEPLSETAEEYHRLMIERA